MLKRIYQTLTCALILLVTIGLFAGQAVAKSWPHAEELEKDKPWTITFSQPADPKTVTSKSVYVTDAKGVKVKNGYVFTNNNTTLTVSAPVGGYLAGASYTLYITDSVKSAEGKSLKAAAVKTFSIKAPVYEVVTVASDGSETVVSTHPTYAAAASAMKTGQAVRLDDRLISMPAGLVVTQASPSSYLTILYEDAALRKQLTYVPPNTELQYVSSTERVVEVALGGKQFFIPQANSSLLPMQTVTDRSYYYVKGGSLFHKMYSHATKKYGSYEAGKAPSFMREGELYYSTDSVHFTDRTGQIVGTAHQYFHFLPMIGQTVYTAQELDTYILAKLKQLERQYPNDPVYKNASQRSKLIGIGSILKRMESKYHVSALHILGIAQHESKYGLSDHALVNNNLFGLYVTDTNPANKKFNSIEENIEELLTAFLTKNYLPPAGMYANGTHLGSKGNGVNVKYASDPYWGAKIAGHMHRIDRDMGGRELANPKDIRLTNTIGLNFRRDPSTGQAEAYKYKQAGMPVVVREEKANTPWVNVQSDLAVYPELYVHGSYLDKIVLP